MSATSRLEIVPLGGLGEFGMNLMVYRFGEDCVVVDAGMMFPGNEHLGVDVVIPDMEFLDGCGTIHGVVLTHGHEDHIGAVPFLLGRRDVPIWGSPYTLGLVRSRLDEHDDLGRPSLNDLPADGAALELGPFRIESIAVTHSIPQARMLVLRTPVGTVVHTADFKLDPDPVLGEGTDLRRLSRLGEEGVLALLSDSTNAERPGFTPGERRVAPEIASRIASARGRVFVTTFASNVHRMQQVVEIAADLGRRVALVGASMQSHAEIAQRLGLLRFPPGSRVQPDAAADLPGDRVVVLATGSQGEPMSAMARIAVDKHREAAIEEGDLVLHSARVIPGNEKSIGRMVNHLLRRGADVVTADDAPIHVSGHPAREELRLLLHLLRPTFLIPIHGEYRQLRAHARLGADAGIDPSRILLADSGDVVALDETSCEVVDRVTVGRVFIDAVLDEVDTSILRERRRIAGDGIVVAVVSIDRARGAVKGTPEIVSRGFVPDSSEDGILAEAGVAVAENLREATREERTDEGLLKARVHTALKRFLRRRTDRRPLIIPVIVEL